MRTRPTRRARVRRRKRPRTTAPSTRAAPAGTASRTSRRRTRPASRPPRRRPRRPDRRAANLGGVAARVRVYLEVGGKRTFATAAGWPGWCRSGKDEAGALDNLAAYAPRYAKVAKLAHLEFPKGAPTFTVVERLKGNATTDFGAPGIPAREESKRMTASETARMLALVEACWKYLDTVRAKAPKELRKGPRG